MRPTDYHAARGVDGITMLSAPTQLEAPPVEKRRFNPAPSVSQARGFNPGSLDHILQRHCHPHPAAHTQGRDSTLRIPLQHFMQ
jgi:hypothetical protein